MDLAEPVELQGHFHITYSPDDGGYYASLWWDRELDCPIFSTKQKALNWARKRGGVTDHTES